ncbi:MAG: PEP-CTERM sorting domain-containing protein [Myxococcota bacterium]
MRWWSGSVLALALMLWSFGMGHAFTLGPERASARTLESAELSGPAGADALAEADELQRSPIPEPSSPDVDEADLAELQLSPIPEPSTMLLFSSGLAGLAIFGNRARRRTR